MPNKTSTQIHTQKNTEFFAATITTSPTDTDVLHFQDKNIEAYQLELSA